MKIGSVAHIALLRAPLNVHIFMIVDANNPGKTT